MPLLTTAVNRPGGRVEYAGEMKGLERIETARLVLRKPTVADAVAVFSRYASDPEVTRYLAWPMHRSIEHTNSFLAFSDSEWDRWPAGPYLVESRADRRLLGGTGLTFQTLADAETGYVFARDAWGQGYATEALGAMTAEAERLGVRRLHALCHADHYASAHVLQKCGFALESLLPEHLEFPNPGTGRRENCLRYVRRFA